MRIANTTQLDALPFTRFHFRLSLVVASFLLVGDLAILTSTFAIPALDAAWALDPHSGINGTLSAMHFIGMM